MREKPRVQYDKGKDLMPMPRWMWKAMVVCAVGSVSLCAQGRGGRGPAPVRTPKEAAPIDLTGYWVSVVTGDWRFRMVTPPKGDFTSMPLNPEGRKIAQAWDPAKDEAAGEQCKAYGAPALMRVPGRLHITWQDDQTLKMEVDSGEQTRLFSFGAPQSKGGDWQGVSKASWELMPGTITATDGGRAGLGSVDGRAGSLRVVTTNFKAGYLRKNGVPYSDKAIVTEFFDRVNEPNGDSYIINTSTVEDPMYLTAPFMLSTHFKKEADGAKWSPQPCTAR
jgi:hypothetical protein